MPRLGKRIQGHRAAELVPSPHDADVVVRAKTVHMDAVGQRRKHPDCAVQRAPFDRLEGTCIRVMGERDTPERRSLAQPQRDAGDRLGGKAVGDCNPEGGGVRTRIEVLRRDRGAQDGERPMDVGPHRHHPRRRPNAVGHLDEQIVLGQLASATKRVAHRGLRHRETRRSACHVAFEHDGFQDGNQIEIEPHVIHWNDDATGEF